MTQPVTRREAVLNGLHVILCSLSGMLPELEIHRNRRAALTHSPSLNLKDGSQSTDAEQTEYKNHVVRPEIEGFLQASSDLEIGPAVNALYGAIIDLLESDVSLGGVADDVIETGLQVEFDTADGAKQASAWFTLSVDIPYTARRESSALA